MESKSYTEFKKSGFPGYNCGQCGYKTCNDLLKATKREESESKKCPFVSKPTTTVVKTYNKLYGIIDGVKADFRIKALPGEHSCRERLLPLTPMGVKKDSFIKYRPIGCPVPHFAKIIEWREGLITVLMVGPRAVKKYKDIGLCMVIGFECIVDGTIPQVGQTVKFIPDKCHMMKVHSSIVTEVIGNKIKLEGVDLKVWETVKKEEPLYNGELYGEYGS